MVTINMWKINILIDNHFQMDLVPTIMKRGFFF